MPYVFTNLIRFVGDSRHKVERQDPRVFIGFLTSLAAEAGDNIFDVDFITLKFANLTFNSYGGAPHNLYRKLNELGYSFYWSATDVDYIDLGCYVECGNYIDGLYDDMTPSIPDELIFNILSNYDSVESYLSKDMKEDYVKEVLYRDWLYGKETAGFLKSFLI